ncbi:MAG: hypothetical protein GY696_38740 [Gammaproteobacteria bacterium]|nr:hypothetical protein [Gammaproteobacteria bacterium]
MSCAGHVTATVRAHKLLECYFHNRDRQVLRILGLVDTGNTVPGSAAISVDLAAKLGVKINPSHLQVTTAAQGSQLEVVGMVANLVMATSPTNLLKLRNVVGHLGLNFCRQFKAKLNYEGDQPRIQIRGESYSLLNSAALEEPESSH